MSDIQTPWLILYGLAAGALYVAAILLLWHGLILWAQQTRPQPAAADPRADHEIWNVLDEARRITEQAAAEEA